MNARDQVRIAIHKIGVGVPFRATDLPKLHNIHDILSALYDNDELDLVSREVHVRGHQQYERRVYSATDALVSVEEADEFAEKWSVAAWAAVTPELFVDPQIPGVVRLVTFGTQEG